jgi:outer membrane protein assembly factor BamB
MRTYKNELPIWLLMVAVMAISSCTLLKCDVPPDAKTLQTVALIPAWQYEAEGKISRIVGLTNDQIILSTSKGQFLSLDMTSGRLVWSHQLPGQIIDITRDDIILKERLIIFTNFIDNQGHRRLTVLDATTGQELWGQDDKHGGQIFGFAVGDKHIYLSLRPHYLARDLYTGETIWQSNLPGSPGQLLYEAGELFMIDPKMPVLDANTGEFKRSLNFEINSTVVNLQAGIIYFFAFGKGQALDTQKNRVLWEKPIGDLLGSSRTWTPLLRNNRIYLGSNGALKVLDASTGEVIWDQVFAKKSDVILYSNPVFVEDTIYAIFSDGSLRAFNDANGIQTGQVEFGAAFTDAALYTTDEMLFVSPGGLNLYAYILKK